MSTHLIHFALLAAPLFASFDRLGVRAADLTPPEIPAAVRGPHMAYAFACERPNKIKAACRVACRGVNVPTAFSFFEGVPDIACAIE